MTPLDDGFDAQAFAGLLMKDVDSLAEWAEAATTALVNGIAQGCENALESDDERRTWLLGYLDGVVDGRNARFDGRIKEAVEQAMPPSLGTVELEGE
ncbi:MAG: hypothetical protein H0V97_09615 [Actinobacteria bacterium]|nr:hypothetical protein [Actinomycetota bacterium]